MTDFIAQPDHGLAWVTGASSGIGRALAKRLAEDGFGVVVTARDLDRLLDLQTEVAASGATGRIIHIHIVNPGFVATPATAKNAFTMPALISPDEAADRIADGLKRQGFEITFPRRFTYWLKLLRLLPYGLYFPLVSRATGWRGRDPVEPATPVSERPA